MRLAVVVAAAAVLGMSACSFSSSSKDKPADEKGKLQIALSNSFIGNGWRVEMENVFKSACATPPYSDQVDCSVFNAGNDVAKQSQQISNLIAQRVDAIVVDAASPTGLNGVIKQACDRDILVVSFDNVVSAPCAGVRRIVGCDRQGAIYRGRENGMNFMKDWYAENTNPDDERGSVGQDPADAVGVVDRREVLAKQREHRRDAVANDGERGIAEPAVDRALPHRGLVRRVAWRPRQLALTRLRLRR